MFSCSCWQCASWYLDLLHCDHLFYWWTIEIPTLIPQMVLCRVATFAQFCDLQTWYEWAKDQNISEYNVYGWQWDTLTRWDPNIARIGRLSGRGVPVTSSFVSRRSQDCIWVPRFCIMRVGWFPVEILGSSASRTPRMASSVLACSVHILFRQS
jgi:hypothetical protein